MKIHRITVHNLGSLYGTHVVDLDTDLNNASLFLIHGSTGAGKSTLMDAIALALFGQTPRLRNDTATAADVPGDNNVRQLASRGTADASAAVTFSRLGADGRRYFTARWSVRRARGRVDGTFQPPIRSLDELDLRFEPLEGGLHVSNDKASAYRAAFAEALDGLRIEDFTRSILLAQGEFSAFLRAEPAERTAILKRVADSEVYRTIGLRAHERWQSATQQVDKLKAVLEQSSAPTEDELAELRSREETLAAEREALQQRLELLDDAERLERDLAELDSAAQQANRRQSELSDRLVELASELESCRAALLQATQGHERVVAEEDTLVPRLEAARQAATARQIAQTRADGAARGLEEAARSQQACERLVGERERAAIEAAARVETLRESATAAIAWLDSSDRVENVVSLCSSLRGQMAERNAVETRLGEQRQRYRELDIDRGACRDKLTVATAALVPLEEGVDLAARRLASTIVPHDDADTAATAFREQRARLSRVIECYAPMPALRSAVEDASLRLREAEARLLAASESAAGLELRAAAAATLENEARQNVERLEQIARGARAAAEVIAVRKALRDGEKCPVCGSIDHPDAHLVDAALLEHLARSEADLASATDALRQAMEAHNDIARALAGEAATARACDEAVAQSRGNLESASRARDEAKARLDRVTMESGIDAELDLVALRERDDELRATESRLADARRQLAEADNKARLARDERQRLATELDTLGAQIEKLVAVGTSLRETHAQASAAVEAALNALREALGRLPQTLTPHEARFDAAGDIDAIEAWLRRQNKLASDRVLDMERAENQARVASADLDNARVASAQAVEALESCRAMWELRRAELEAADKDARSWFDGRDLVMVEQESRERRNVAQKAVAAATESLARKESESAALSGQLATMDVDAKVRQLRRTELLERLEVAVRSLRSVASPGDVDQSVAAWLEESRATVTGALDEANVALGSVRERLRAAEATHAKHGALVEQYRTALDEVAFWSEMNFLIGKRQGEAFAEFAQALTLERLLDAANVHLRQLAPRYSYVVRRDNDGFPTLVFDVRDHDQADTLRPITTLSGGETFLCSLALALGLSDLHRLRLPIETLLLDEGFGTLDPETLDVAIGALEQLHASGARVGIISHVTELQQRVPARIFIRKLGNGRSEIVLPSGGLASDPR